MPSVALLGPQHSFSHEFAGQCFGDHDHRLCLDFAQALELVTSRTVDKALIPLENSNASTIKRAQYDILARRGRIFVTDLGCHHIRLDLYSFTTIDKVTTVRSFTPVFAQTKQWLDKYLPTAARNGEFQSTSDAVLSFHQNGREDCAAIGSQSASFYQVPTLVADIQTEPNITVFATISNHRPIVSEAERILIGIESFEEDDARLLLNVLSNNGCAFDADWIIRHDGESFGVFEVKSLQGFSLETALNAVESASKKCFLLGAYSGKTITRLECEKHSV